MRTYNPNDYRFPRTTREAFRDPYDWWQPPEHRNKAIVHWVGWVVLVVVGVSLLLAGLLR